ncbi:MAG: FAD-dependent oxidoreductase [Xanthobacteraceae bacterium]
MNIAVDHASIIEVAPAPFHVVIIGGGIGGLTLAQGLRQVGISAAVYERDRTPTDRLQGYRVHISPAGSLALHACLPPHLFDAFERTCGKEMRVVRFLTEKMAVLLDVDQISGPEKLDGEGIARHRSVSRIALRQVLLSGLENVVHFDKIFNRYEERADGRIVAQFADGTAAEGDVLVAADGGGSRVRHQLLPQAQRIDTGVISIAGKVFLDASRRRRIAPLLLDGLSLVSAKGGLGLFVALQELGDDAVDHGVSDGAAANEAVSSGHFDDARSYLMWALSARREKFGLDPDTATLDGERLRGLALGAMARWDDRFIDLVRLSEGGTISLLPIRTSVPTGPWPTKRVTLIGDAIHSMTPFRGIGANVALKDAVRLRDALVAAHRGQRPLLAAIHDYEAAMIAYGFSAVRESLRAMEQIVTESELRRAVSRAAFRVIEALPPVKRRLFGRLGND